MHSNEEIETAGIYTNDQVTLASVFQNSIDNLKLPNICLYSVVGYFRSSGYFPLTATGQRNYDYYAQKYQAFKIKKGTGL